MQLDVAGLDSLDLAGKRVLIRVDFNVPMQDGVVGDDTRIRASLPTIRAVLAAGGRPILLTHLGRPKGQVVESLRVGPVAARLRELLGVEVVHVSVCRGPEAVDAIGRCPRGGVVLLENVRFEPGEERGDAALARDLAALGDVFVNDAFGASHRAHASVSGIPAHLPSAAGHLLLAEVQAFQRVLHDPARPFVLVLGGAKVSDKLPVIEHLLERVECVLIGGGMAYTFLVAQGVPVGKSLVQSDQLDQVRRTLARARELGVEFLCPEDHVTAAEFSAAATPTTVEGPIPADQMGLDIGPRTAARYASRIRDAGTLVWNGPMGVFEFPAFAAGTRAVGQAVAACPGYTVVGGGDSVAAIEGLGLASRIGHVSTGGGASLELLEGRDLPGISALARRR